MLTFKNVTFRYPEDKEAMMTNLSFQVDQGEFVSLIGASGCGKSTNFSTDQPFAGTGQRRDFCGWKRNS